jgi:putative membrane-bound dehydrogenase-like protein
MNRTLAVAFAHLLAAAASAQSPALRVPEGFTIRKVAGEPHVLFPMFACFDDRGRLFVCESTGKDLYKEIAARTRECRLTMLEDRDGDGAFETATVFAERLNFPMGVAWRDGKLYVADPPDLVALEDTDGDGKADKRTVVITGFGHKDNGSLHGVTFGPDGLLYFTMGDPDGYKLKRPDGTLLEGRSGALLRCRPDGTHPEVIARGFENLVEVVFLPTGEIIGTVNWFRNVNSKDSGGLRDALVHLIDGGLYPRHLRDVGSPLPLTGEALPAVSMFPAVALSGLMHYRGTAFPEAMRGNLFSAQHNSRKVGRHVLARSGSTFASTDLDFVVGDDPDFHPSDVLEDADGSLLVIDTGGWYVHHCPTGKIRDSKAPGGIYRVRYTAAPKVEDPWGLKIDWKGATLDRVLALLGDPRPNVRDRAEGAFEELRARRQVAPKSLIRLLVGPSARARTHVLRALGPMAAVLPIVRAGNNADDLCTIARLVASWSGDWEPSAADGIELSTLIEILSSPNPHVVLAGAELIARRRSPDSLATVVTALASGNPDRHLEHALVHAIHKLADEKILRELLGHAHPRVQKAALVLLDQPPRPAGLLQPDDVFSRVRAADPELRKVALFVLLRHPEWADRAVGLLKQWIETKNLSAEERTAFRELSVAFGARPAVQAVLTAAAADGTGKIATDRRVAVLESIAALDLPKPPPAVIDAVGKALATGEAAVRMQAVRTAAALAVPAMDNALSAIAEDAAAAAGLRIEAFRAIVGRRPDPSAAVFELLIEGLGEDSEPAARLTAAGVLGRSRLNDEQIGRLVKAARGNPIVSPSTILPALERASAEPTAGAVMDYLDHSVKAGWRPGADEPARLESKLPGALRPRIDSLRKALADATARDRARVIDYEKLLTGGDPQRGRAVFFGKAVGCVVCHRVGVDGGSTGPDLTRVGAIRAGRDILESIVLPSSTIAQGFDAYAVQTVDDRIVAGVLARQSADGIVLRDAAGAEVRLRNAEIRALKRQATSIMPEGLDRKLTEQEFRDLLAYLQSLK